MRKLLLATALASCLTCLGFAQTSSVVRYGAIYSFRTHAWQGVLGGKIEEIVLASKRFANPEIWAAGATNATNSEFNAILAEPWYITKTLTIYPHVAASFQDKKLGMGLGISIQFTVIKF